MLSDDDLAKAGQDLFAVHWADMYEEFGGRLGGGTNIADEAPRADRDRLIPILRDAVARVEAKWGRPLEDVYRELGVAEDDWADLCYYQFMQLAGHGVGPDDFLDDRYPGASSGDAGVDLTPGNDELYPLDDLAYEAVQADLRERADEGPIQNGTYVTFETRLPPGDSLAGDGWVRGYSPRRAQYVVEVHLATKSPHKTGKDDTMRGELYLVDANGVTIPE